MLVCADLNILVSDHGKPEWDDKKIQTPLQSGGWFLISLRNRKDLFATPQCSTNTAVVTCGDHCLGSLAKSLFVCYRLLVSLFSPDF
jgi:hypothetical protein